MRYDSLSVHQQWCTIESGRATRRDQWSQWSRLWRDASNLFLWFRLVPVAIHLSYSGGIHVEVMVNQRRVFAWAINCFEKGRRLVMILIYKLCTQEGIPVGCVSPACVDLTCLNLNLPPDARYDVGGVGKWTSLNRSPVLTTRCN